MKSIIIDTDIGSDIDDALALMMAIKSNLDIKLITTVHGDTKVRARIAKKLTQLLGKDIPVAYGEENPINQNHIFWIGNEGKDFIDNHERYDIIPNAVDRIAETAYANKGIEIAAIGPLTNIAKALKKYKGLENYISHIYMMGNAVLHADRYFINYRAHNFKVDPDAVDIVINSSIKKTIITTEVSKQNYLADEDFRTIKSLHNGASDYICKSVKEWQKVINCNLTYLYDPLTIYHIIDYDITKKKTIDNTMVTIDADKSFKQKFMDIMMR